MTMPRRALLRSMLPALGGTALFGVSGCASYITTPVIDHRPFDRTGKVDRGQPDDPIWSDDHALAAPMRFGPEDIVRLTVYQHPELLTDAEVQADGSILLPIVGRLKAAGRSPDELREEVVGRMQERLKIDRVRLERGTVLEMSVFERPELTHAATVQLDGMVIFPVVGEVPAAGRTIDELKQDVQTRLGKVLRDPIVTIIPQRLPLNDLAGVEIAILPQRVQPRQVVVLGEVALPNTYPIHARTRVANILAAAHTLDTGNLNDVVIIRDRVGGKPKYRSLRMVDFTSGKAPGENLLLLPDDVLIVPKSPIVALDIYIQQLFTSTAPIFNWYISLQDAAVASDLARQVQLLNDVLKVQ